MSDGAPANPTVQRRRRRSRDGAKLTADFSITNADNQRIALEAFRSLLEREQLKWKRTRLQSLIRRVSRSLEVNERKSRVRRIGNSRTVPD